MFLSGNQFLRRFARERRREQGIDVFGHGSSGDGIAIQANCLESIASNRNFFSQRSKKLTKKRRDSISQISGFLELWWRHGLREFLIGFCIVLRKQAFLIC
jgi:hypothetical protein